MMSTDDMRQLARRAWIISHDRYCAALEACDRTGERWAHNKTGPNRARFDAAQKRLREVEQDLYAEYDKKNPS
jgi:hypothetical protein